MHKAARQDGVVMLPRRMRDGDVIGWRDGAVMIVAEFAMVRDV